MRNLTPVVDGRGRELVLDRPTSMEFVGDTAYVVSVVGDIYSVDNLKRTALRQSAAQLQITTPVYAVRGGDFRRRRNVSPRCGGHGAMEIGKADATMRKPGDRLAPRNRQDTEIRAGLSFA